MDSNYPRGMTEICTLCAEPTRGEFERIEWEGKNVIACFACCDALCVLGE